MFDDIHFFVDSIDTIMQASDTTEGGYNVCGIFAFTARPI